MDFGKLLHFFLKERVLWTDIQIGGDFASKSVIFVTLKRSPRFLNFFKDLYPGKTFRDLTNELHTSVAIKGRNLGKSHR